jgi:Ca-activated chloride channel family protein
MIFQHPQLLGLLALPVILAFWEWTRHGQPIAMPFDHGQQTRGRLLHFLVLCANCLPAALLAIAILFLAHPMTHTPPEVERQLNNVQIVLDTSGSMAENHGPQNRGRHRRFDSAMEAIEQFITYRQGDAFGLTIFGREFIHWLPLTLDTQSIPLSKRFIEPYHSRLDPPSSGHRGFPDDLWGGTFIGKALHGAADLLAQRPDGDRMIILMTDGESRDINPPLDTPIIEHLRSEKVTLFTIMLTGDEISAPLTHITRATGGEVFNAVTPAALASVFQRIDEMKKVVVLEKRPQVIDFYEPFLMPALSLLGLSILALFGLRFTPW